MVLLQVIEPGSYPPAKINLSQRWGPDNTVVVGVARDGVGSNHIAFRKPASFLSRRQVTIMALDGDDRTLLVRDGGKNPDGTWSREWKHTYIDDRKLTNNDWIPFNVGERLRFHPEKPPTAGYCVQLAYDDTDGTHGLDTVHFDTVQAWSAISRTSRGTGTMLLSVPTDDGVAIIIRLDSHAERLLGSESGELKEVEESCILNNLLPVGPVKARLSEHINEAMRYPRQIFHGEYDFGAGLVSLRLENRLINSQYALFGWLTLKEPVKELRQSGTDWKTEAVAGAVQWAKDNPWLATILAMALAIAVLVIKLSGT